MVLVQETWTAVVQRESRFISSFWMEKSRHQGIGNGLEIWCQGAWAHKLAVLTDQPYALLVLVRSVRGVGIIGTVHMAQRAEGPNFEAQMTLLMSVMRAAPHDWAMIGGDWNRDIRRHVAAQTFIFNMGAWVAFMEGQMRLPKDFVILKGITGQSVGQWLDPIGDHPVVIAKGVASVQAGSTRSASRPN